MKRIFYTALCALMTLGASAQTQKVMRIHKTDGTVLEYYVAELHDFSFKGMAVVSDDEYTQISKLDLVMEGNEINFDITVNFGFDDQYITGSRYGKDWGILYSTSPDVTVENSTLVELKSPLTSVDNLSSHRVSFRLGESVKEWEYNYNERGVNVDLEYATTYYFRSFVYRPAIGDLYEEQYFYSAVKSVAVGNPSMSLYGASILPDYVAEKGYVYPSSSAWNEFNEQYPYFDLRDARYRAEIITLWNDYLTPERHEAFKAQCTTVHECAEGKLYLIDTIGKEFLDYLLGVYSVEYTMPGYTELLNESTHTVGTYVECDVSWNVPGNGYWKYTADEKRNPSIRIQLSKNMLANYRYKVELTLAPNTDPEETLPSKVTVMIDYATGGATIANKLVTNVGECTVITADELVSNSFGTASLEILSDMKIGPEGKKYSPILRVAQIKVTPCEPSSEKVSVE